MTIEEGSQWVFSEQRWWRSERKGSGEMQLVSLSFVLNGCPVDLNGGARAKKEDEEEGEE